MCGGYIWTPDLNKERLPDAVRSRAASCLCRTKVCRPRGTRNENQKTRYASCVLNNYLTKCYSVQELVMCESTDTVRVSPLRTTNCLKAEIQTLKQTVAQVVAALSPAQGETTTTRRMLLLRSKQLLPPMLRSYKLIALSGPQTQFPLLQQTLSI